MIKEKGSKMARQIKCSTDNLLLPRNSLARFHEGLHPGYLFSPRAPLADPKLAEQHQEPWSDRLARSNNIKNRQEAHEDYHQGRIGQLIKFSSAHSGESRG
jgi:hypothetical protein